MTNETPKEKKQTAEGCKIIGQDYELTVQELIEKNISYGRISKILEVDYSVSLSAPTIKQYAINFMNVEDEMYMKRAEELRKKSLRMPKDPADIVKDVLRNQRYTEIDGIIRDIKYRIKNIKKMGGDGSLPHERMINQYYRTIKELREYQTKYQFEHMKDEIETKMVSKVVSVVVNLFMPAIPQDKQSQILDDFKRKISEIDTSSLE